ncbi:PCC domain-containing protein [Alsobacter sp. R-9]
MTRPTFIRQPGPPPAERLAVVEGRGRSLTLSLERGRRLVDAVADGFAAHGFPGGTVDLRGLRLGPFGYVMPALSATPQHAAFYSDTFRPTGVTVVEGGAMTFGVRDGAPFFHAHALWQEADGHRSGGHILPDETLLAAEAVVEAFGFDGGVFTGTVDPETNFKLFEPAPAPSRPVDASSRAFAVRLRPNQDFAGALEALCRREGIARARLRGGVGSTIGAHFDEGQVVEAFATEVFLDGATIEAGPDGPVAHLCAGLVDYTGAMARGVLARGDNPVLMTFELVVEQVG